MTPRTKHATRCAICALPIDPAAGPTHPACDPEGDWARRLTPRSNDDEQEAAF